MRDRRSMHVAGVLLFLICVACAPAYADSIIQDLQNSGIQIEWWGPEVGQSFLAGDAHIQVIGAFIEEMNPGFGRDLIANIYAGDGISGSPLLSQTLTPSEGFVGFADIDVSSMIFTVGQTYTFSYIANSPDWGVYLSADYPGADPGELNPYANGRAYFNPLQDYIAENSDLQFHVIADGGTSVPEPTSLLLLGTGIVGLAAVARRRMK